MAAKNGGGSSKMLDNITGSKIIVNDSPVIRQHSARSNFNNGDDTDSDSSSCSDESEPYDYENCDCVDDHACRVDRIPYSAIYDTQDEVHTRGYFNPSLPVDARIVHVERDASGTIHLINPYIYTIELEHGNYKWVVYRRYIDFQHLHNRLLLFRAASKVAAPMRRIKNRDRGARPSTTPTADLVYENDTYLVEEKPSVTMSAGERSSEEINLPTIKYGNTHRRRSSAAVETEKRMSVKTEPALASMNGGSSAKENRAKKRPCKLPHFPMLPDSVISQDRLEERKAELQRYLSAVLHIYAYRNHPETAEFLEVSRLSFVHNLGAKLRESFIKKRPGGTRQFHGVTRFCIANCAKWSIRWLVVKDTFVAYLHPRTEEIRYVLLFDADFTVKAGPGETEGVKRGLLISNMQRNLMLKCSTVDEAVEWKRAILAVTETVGKPWLERHRFGSSYPVRENSHAQWFVDGATYMEHVANMMELAKEEIFITDWWLSPEIYLKRPMTEGDRWRLNEVLKRKAKQGVRIFVLLYKEVTMALGIASLYSKRQLAALHPNIKVLRHPDHLPGTGVLLWAHHEKIVVIDQNIAFVGGIDLCYGRWDDHRHRLTDFGSVKYQNDHSAHLQRKTVLTGMKSVAQMFGTLNALDIDPIPMDGGENLYLAAAAPDVVEDIEADATSPEVEGPSRGAILWSQVKNADVTGKTLQPVVHRGLSVPSPSPSSVPGQILDRPLSVAAATPAEKRMDLGDIVRKYRQFVESGAIQAEKSRGSPPTQRKRKRNKVAKYIQDWKAAHARRKREQQEEPIFSTDYENSWRQLQEESHIDLGLSGGGKLWMGKDYVNFIQKDFTDLDMPFHDFIDRACTPRMPWHDIASVVYGSAARDVARHFIQRWNACKAEKARDSDSLPFLMPKSYENVRVPRVFRNISTPCNVQVLRSATLWSVGMNAVEESIHQAYLRIIEEAKHYIYIENQFFVSQVGGGQIHNQVAKALFDRIVRAHKNNENFRVYIMMPLLPGFEGQLGTTAGSALQVVLHWTYVSIAKGPHSLLRNLEAEIGDYSRYLTFCSLRTHDELVGRLVTEIIYIHSKLIIVDDRVCIIGSANINDRSQLGKRDSEVGVYVEDTEFFPSTMNDQPFKSGNFCGGLRRHLLKEHLGLLDDGSTTMDIEDIVSETFFNQWKKIAAENTDIYEKVFGCFPCENVQSFEDLLRHHQQIPLCDYNKSVAEEMLKRLRGRLVLFPTRFLILSDLAPSIASKEGLAPAHLFT